MATLYKRADIITGDIFRQGLEISLDNVPLPTDALVRAVLTDTSKKTVYTSVKTCEYNAGINGWIVEFSGSDTRNLLDDPDNLASALLSKQCFLEVQIGNPYNITLHWLLSIEKGLIS